MRRYQARLRRGAGASDEGGFSLIEVTVAVGILAFVLATMAQNLAGGLGHVGMAKQRQQATAMANGVLERVRGLAFDQVAMASADLAGDPAIVGGTFRGRQVVTTEDPADVLQPHRRSEVVDGTTFDLAVYVTVSPDVVGARVVTVRADWSPKLGAGDPVVEMQTLVSEHTCEAQANGQPCQPYWYAAAQHEDASIRVQGTVNGAPVDTELRLDGTTVRSVTEQFTTAVAEAATTSILDGGTVVVPTAAAVAAGTDRAVATADDSLLSATGTFDAPVRTGPTAALDRTSGGLRITGGVATAGAVATTQATGQVASGHSGSLPTTGLPYAHASRSSSTSTAVTLDLPGETIVLARLGDTVAAARATVTRRPGAVASLLEDDSTEATAARSLPTIDVLDLPAALRPAGWPGQLVRLTGWSATATSTSGPDAAAVAAPSATSAGSVQWWQGAAPTTTAHAQSAVEVTPSVATTLAGCTVSASGNADLGGRTVSTGLERSATVAAPLVGTFRWRYECGADVIADLTIQVNLGATVATTRYTAPDA